MKEIIYLLLIFSIAACKKQNLEPAKKNYITMVFESGHLIKEYEYNSDFQNTRVNYYRADTLFFYELISFDKEKRIVKMEYPAYFEDYSVYIYDNDQNHLATKKSFDINTDELLSYSIYEYNNGKLSKVKKYDGDSVIQYKKVFEYDAEENVSKVTSTSESNTQYNWVTKYKYDNKNNVYLYFTNVPGIPIQKHNITEATNTSGNSYTSTFQYNVDNFPISETREYIEQQRVSNFTYEYTIE